MQRLFIQALLLSFFSFSAAHADLSPSVQTDGASKTAFSLETSVSPKVTTLSVASPKTGLYIGNSYSFYNCGVHGYVRGFTREEKRKWSARLVTISSGRLSYHNVEDYLKPHPLDNYKLAEGSDRLFDVVFLQAQSSEPISTKNGADENFRKYLRKHIESIRKAGSEPVVVVTWADAGKPENYRKLADAIITEANKNNAAALPVGLAFAESLKMRPDLILHQSDNKHPTAAGSYLYGAMIYSFLFRKSPEGSRFLGECEKPLSVTDAQFLQSLAWKVTKEFYGWK